MRTLIVSEFITADGIVDSPGGGEHPAAGWTFKDVEFDESVYELKGREQQESDALLMGRVSYTEFAPVWPQMAEFAKYNAMPKYVVSTTLETADWGGQPANILRSLDDVAQLKQTDGGPIILAGSPTLAQGLAAAGLVDQYNLLVFPLLLGHGKRLFADNDAKRKLTVIESEVYRNGIVKLVYTVDNG